jgi:hypothetical protein
MVRLAPHPNPASAFTLSTTAAAGELAGHLADALHCSIADLRAPAEAPIPRAGFAGWR